MDTDDKVTAEPVRAERLVVSRTLATLGSLDRQRIPDVIWETERDLVEALKSTGKDLETVAVQWTCTVVGLTTPEEV